MITDEQLQDLEACDEYSLRHYAREVQALIESYRQTQATLARLTRWGLVVGDAEGVQFSRDHPIALAQAALIHCPEYHG